jgi:AcrR family transcriptional regulator
MAQNKAGSRGRPRKYDPDVALAAAANVFWTRGYSATSLDDLGQAMGMNRPSIQAAFGDKSELFVKVLRRYSDTLCQALTAGLSSPLPLREALRQLFLSFLDQFAHDRSPSGCLLFTVATTEAENAPEVRALLDAAVRELDRQFEARFKAARVAGEIPTTANVRELALLASGLAHTLSIRARAGESRRDLTRVLDAYLAVLFQPG